MASARPARPVKAPAGEAAEQAEISRRVEQRSVQALGARLEADAGALQRFHELGLAAQMQLVHETVLSRQSELTLAYRNVVRVSAGFRRCGGGPTGTGHLTDEPCVVFTVRRKWRTPRDSPQALPRHLLAFATLGGLRMQVAIPTDAQLETDHRRTLPQARATAIRVHAPGEQAFGAVTCLLELQTPAEPARRLLLSAMHVLSPTVDAGTGPGADHRITPNRGAAREAWGKSTGMGGWVDAIGRGVFDVQLASAPQPLPPGLVAALAELPWDPDEPFVSSFVRLCEFVAAGLAIEIAAPSNHDQFLHELRPALAARLSGLATPGAPISYWVRVDSRMELLDLHHSELLELEPLGGAGTLPGDSGCAVVCWLGDARCSLVGMHIASNTDTRIGFAIPAWQLLRRENFAGSLPAVCRLTPAIP
jgi:hypothetical protein